MSTGVAVADDAIAEYNDFKRSSNPGRYMLFKIENGLIVVDSKSEDPSYEAFLGVLPADDGRYAVYKMDFTTHDGRPNQKIVSISW
jgi:hypothetical protein